MSPTSIVVSTPAFGSAAIAAGTFATHALFAGVQMDVLDVSAVAGCADLEVLALVAEHGAYVLLGRVEGGMVNAVHSADPWFADLVIQRLGEATGTRLMD